MPFELYEGAYRQCFPQHHAGLAEWQRSLEARCGSDLGIQHYIVHVQPKRPGPTTWTITDNLAEKYGESFAPRPRTASSRSAG